MSAHLEMLDKRFRFETQQHDNASAKEVQDAVATLREAHRKWRERTRESRHLERQGLVDSEH